MVESQQHPPPTRFEDCVPAKSMPIPKADLPALMLLTWTRRTRRCCLKHVRVWPTSAERRRNGRHVRGSWRSPARWPCCKNEENSRRLESTSRLHQRKATTSITTLMCRWRRRFLQVSSTLSRNSITTNENEKASTHGNSNLPTNVRQTSKTMEGRARRRRKTKSPEGLQHRMLRLRRCRKFERRSRAARDEGWSYQRRKLAKLKWRTLSRWGCWENVLPLEAVATISQRKA